MLNLNRGISKAWVMRMGPPASDMDPGELKTFRFLRNEN
jgi:hypothetical protein